MTTLEVLVATRDLIADESRWTQGALARDEMGISDFPGCISAVRWCLHGACMKAAGFEKDWRVIDNAQALFSEMMRCDDFMDYNDSHTHAEVIAALNKTIEAAGAQ